MLDYTAEMRHLRAQTARLWSEAFAWASLGIMILYVGARSL